MNWAVLDLYVSQIWTNIESWIRLSLKSMIKFCSNIANHSINSSIPRNDAISSISKCETENTYHYAGLLLTISLTLNKTYKIHRVKVTDQKVYHRDRMYLLAEWLFCIHLDYHERKTVYSAVSILISKNIDNYYSAENWLWNEITYQNNKTAAVQTMTLQFIILHDFIKRSHCKRLAESQ